MLTTDYDLRVPLTHIPLLLPQLPTLKQLTPYLKRIDDNRIYTNFGPLVKEFEQRLARYFHIEPTQLVAMSNATLALEGAIQTRAKPNTIWDCPSWTFAATPLSIKRAGMRVRFQDVGPDWRMKPSEEGFSESIVDVLPFGDEANFGRFNLNIDSVVIDGAASFSNLDSIGDQLPANVGLIVSFHATKILQTGEGGVFISKDSEWVEKVRKWSAFGFGVDKQSSFESTNAKMSEYAGAVGLASLDQWPERRKKFLEITQRAGIISNKFNIQVHPALEKGLITPYWIIISDKVKAIEKVFQEQGIETRKWWKNGCHKMPAFRSESIEFLPNTDYYVDNNLGLPFFVGLTDQQFKRIENALETALSRV
jgi:dTDP-4-amino-4,6-dideoxygalactose transaminase